jgi:hypothetical protein
VEGFRGARHRCYSVGSTWVISLVAFLHAPIVEGPLVDLESSVVTGAGIVDLAWIRVAGFHVKDAHDAAVDVEERDRQRDEGVLHPEPTTVFLEEQEDHPGIFSESLAFHETERSLFVSLSDLDIQQDGIIPGVDECPTVPEGR